MSISGVRSNHFPVNSLADEVLTNRAGTTGRTSIARLAAQITSAIGPTVRLVSDLSSTEGLNWDDGTVAKVVGDGALSGVYQKSGAAGTGSWAKIGPLPEGDTELIRAGLDDLAAQITAANNGLPSLAARLLALASEEAAARNDAINGALADFVGAAPAALDTVYEIAAALGGDPNVINNLLTSLGSRLRFDQVQALSTPQKSQALANLGLADLLQKLVDLASADASLQTQLTDALQALLLKDNALQTQITSLDVLIAASTITQTIGGGGSAIGSGTAGDAVFFFAAPADRTGPVRHFALGAKAAGDVHLKRGALVNGILTQIGADVTVTVPGPGFQLLVNPAVAAMTVNAGEYLGVHGPGVIAYEEVQGPAFYESPAGSGNVSTFTAGNPKTAVNIQANFSIAQPASALIPELDAETLVRRSIESMSHITQVIGGGGSAMGAGTVGNETFVWKERAIVDSFVPEVAFWAQKAGPVWIKVGDYDDATGKFTQIGGDVKLNARKDLNVLSGRRMPPIYVPAGKSVGFHAPGVIAIDFAKGPAFYSTNGNAGNVTSFTDPSIADDATIQINVTLQAAKPPLMLEATSKIQRIGSKLPLVDGQRCGETVFTFGEFVIADGIAERLGVFLKAASTYEVKVQRFTGEPAYQWVDYKSYSFFGNAGFNERRVAIKVKAGDRIGFYGPEVSFALYNVPERDGYYALDGGTANAALYADGTLAVNAQLQMYCDIRYIETASQQCRPVFGDSVLDVDVVVSGLTMVTSRIVLGRNDDTRVIGESGRTIAATTGSNVRYDHYLYDIVAGALNVLQGTERAKDAPHFRPKVTSSSQISLAYLRVQNGTFKVLPLTRIENGECVELSGPLARKRRENRPFLRPIRNKIERHLSITFMTAGDSLQAMQGGVGGVPSRTAPNGPYRDRATAPAPEGGYLLDAYGPDVVATVPLYTAVENGMPDDGAGKVHTRVGYVWELVAVLIKDYGYQLGVDLFIKNFAVAGTSTIDLIDVNGNPTPWMLAIEAQTADLIVYNHAQNELGNSGTEQRYSTILGRWKQAGHTVLSIGTNRPTWPGVTVDHFDMTASAIQRACAFRNVAHIPLTHLYDPRYIKAMGLFFEDRSGANAINHKGFIEIAACGLEIIKTLLE
ncbi:hypothetical protein C8J31_10278 [Rhizobium sp. PP-CC-2G-626]|nr:hypothetical protein C8J31_10278 [Rhizobium sp. PP-CC-2G-626]